MIEPIELDAWMAFDAKHPAPTFFARPAWARALAYAYPSLQPFPVRVRTASGPVILPLVKVSGGRLGWREVVGMPLGAYTCALRADGTLASSEEFAEALRAVCRETDSVSITPWPLADYEFPAMPWRKTPHETSVIDLSQGYDAALQGVEGVSRRMAGQAARRGVACEPNRSGLAAATYFAMLTEASEHWGLGRPPYPRELLDGLIEYGGSDVEVWFATCDNHPIAGGVVFYGSEELFFWSAAMRQAFTRMRPSNALNLALIRAACDRRLRWYNLGASEGLPGVERFKRGLGARRLDYHTLARERKAFSVYTRLRASMRRERVGGGA